MKKINYLLATGIAVLSMIAASCSTDNNDTSASAPIFPQTQTLTIEAGTQQEVSFDANLDWTLTSGKQWLKFVDQVGETQSLLGKAGKNTALLKVSNANQGFETESAEVTLTMGGKQQVVFTIERPGRERAVKMYTKDGLSSTAETIEIEQVEMPYEGSNRYVNFVANFDWRVISAPDWILVNNTKDIRELTGEANVEKLNRSDMAIISIDPLAAYKDNTGFIVIGAQAEGIVYEQRFAISAAGIPEKEIKWSQSNLIKTEGFLFTQKGKWRKNVGINLYEEVAGPATFRVRVRDHAYTVKQVAWVDGRPQELTTPWANVTDDRAGNLSVGTPENNDPTREALLFVVPEGVTVDYAEYFTPQGVAIGGTYALLLYQAGIDKVAFLAVKGSYLTDVLTGVTDASDENKAMARSLGVTTDNICEKVFTAEEWAYDDALPTSGQQITIVVDLKTVGLSDVKMYDKEGNATDGKIWGTLSVQLFSGLPSCKISGRKNFAGISSEEKLLLVFYGSDGSQTGAFFVLKN